MARRLEDVDDLLAIHGQRRQPLPRAEAGALRRRAAVADRRFHDEALGVVRAAEQHRPSRLGAAQLLRRVHEAGEKAVQMGLPAEARADLLERSQEMGGVGQLLQEVHVRAGEAAAVHGRRHGRQQQAQWHCGLGDIVQDADLRALRRDLGIGVGVAGQDHELGLGALGLDARDELEARHPRQHEVHDGGGESAVGRGRERGLGVRENGRPEAPLRQDLGNHRAEGRVVVHDEDERLGCGHCGLDHRRDSATRRQTR